MITWQRPTPNHSHRKKKNLRHRRAPARRPRTCRRHRTVLRQSARVTAHRGRYAHPPLTPFVDRYHLNVVHPCPSDVFLPSKFYGGGRANADKFWDLVCKIIPISDQKVKVEITGHKTSRKWRVSVVHAYLGVRPAQALLMASAPTDSYRYLSAPKILGNSTDGCIHVGTRC